MDKKLMIDPVECYKAAEERAAHYFETLYKEVSQKSYIPILMKDIETWKCDHVHRYSWLSSFFSRYSKKNSRDYHYYIRQLKRSGKLDSYLERSIAYIFMRDLGKSLHSPKTQSRVREIVTRLKDDLISSHSPYDKKKVEMFSIAELYRKAKKEGIESTFIWLMNKLKKVSLHIPNGMDAEHAKRKLIKIIAGVLLHAVEEMNDDISPEERKRKLDEAIRLGYSYGLTYPFIDDLLDAHILSPEEEKRYSDLIRMSLLTGTVPPLGEWKGNHGVFMNYVHSELKEAFHYIKAQQHKETLTSFFEQAYIFFQSQEADRQKDLTYEGYRNEEIYIPVIIKSASSRSIIRSVLNTRMDEEINRRTFFYGIYNQLADDFTDMFDDWKVGAVTPYTYYMEHHKKRSDLINPFELYWTVISYLIHQVYHGDPKTCEVILSRAINSLKRFKEKVGPAKYDDIMQVLSFGTSQLFDLIQRMVHKADDVDFFDKLLRDQIIETLKQESEEREQFLAEVENIRHKIDATLPISISDHDSFLLKDSIVEAANYSLEGAGKRLRPIITWLMGVHQYRFDEESILPLIKSLEYMHTASLIYDDLPSQDNAAIRRGRQTLHEKYNTAVAELTALFLTQKAVGEQASLHTFDAETVLKLINYTSKVTELMCRGQAIDLAVKGKKLTLEQLNEMSFYKTGLAFEASLVMPAILAQAKEAEIESLKQFAYHAGIAFQIKDDLLDIEGDFNVLGKPVDQDRENHHSTFVTVLGKEEAEKALWEQYYLAIEVLQGMPDDPPFLKHLLNYIVNRNH